jgi:hypothetical protein
MMWSRLTKARKMPESQSPNPLDPTQLDAYKFTKAQFDEEWRNLGKPTAPIPNEDPPRDADGRFSAEPLGDAYKKSNREFAEGWTTLGHPPKGDGHPVVPFKRLAAIREQLWGQEPAEGPKERETA